MNLLLLPSLLLLLNQCLIFSSAAKSSYVVYLGEHEHSSDLELVDDEKVRDKHIDFLGSFLGSREQAAESIFDSYSKHINGFAATMDEATASLIAEHPDVISVFPNRGRKLHTTRSWTFLGLEQNGFIPTSSLWKQARFGEDTIIANLDTGVWPESESFSDKGMGPIPARFKGKCVPGSDPTFRCNRKLIGARFFNKGWLGIGGVALNVSTNSPRDAEGHGTHTLSTAGGAFVPGASVFGYGNGTAAGGSPRARVVAYRVCFPPIDEARCLESDIMAAFDAAIADGVDVLSVSLGGDATSYFIDGVSIGAFHATKRGIVVVSSAGNDGPTVSSVGNVAPWHFTVGASTMDREFPSYVVLGNNRSFKGQSLSQERLVKKFYPIIRAISARRSNATAEDAQLCKPNSLDPTKARGKILVCLRGSNPRVDKGQQASLVGAVGMVLINNATTANEILADPHVLPASHLSYSHGEAVNKYIASTRSPVAYITYPSTRLGVKPAPVMAAFSAKGPNPVTPEILKPDITAPGVSIIAAFSEAVSPTGQDFDIRRTKFNSVSGTSMSCPEMAGIVGLMKTMHPSWSPAAIKSAIMTTASTMDSNSETILNSSYKAADTFSYGAGHVNPNKAMDPGLVYDLQEDDYIAFLCSLGYTKFELTAFSKPIKCPSKKINLVNFNYPAITIPRLNGSITVLRTLTNVGPTVGPYRPVVRSPPGITTVVKPRRLDFSRVGVRRSFLVTMKGSPLERRKKYTFGDLSWVDGVHVVRIPISVNW